MEIVKYPYSPKTLYNNSRGLPLENRKTKVGDRVPASLS